MKRRIIFIFWFSILALNDTLLSQSRIEYIDLLEPAKENTISFSKILVVDNRFDTSSIIKVSVGQSRNSFLKSEVIEYKWRNSINSSIKKYFEKVFSNEKNEKILLIEIRHFQLYIYNIYFTANVYVKNTDSNFAKIFAIDTCIFYNKWQVGFEKRILEILRKKIIQNVTNNVKSQFSIEVIKNNNVNNAWKELTINKQALDTGIGIYESNSYFVENKLKQFSLQLNELKDSVFEIKFIGNDQNEKLSFTHLLTLKRGRGIIQFKGSLFYLLDYKYCIPITKKWNTFYFHIPASLPNMLYFDAKWLNSYLNTQVGLSNVNNITDLIVVAGGDYILQTLKDSHESSFKRMAMNDSSFRDCYIDLDIGSLCYF